MRILIIFIFFISNVLASEMPNIKNLVLNKEPKTYDNIIFLDSDEKFVKLSDYKGKLVIINFWATWCAPCKEEMPSLDVLKDNPNSKITTIPLNLASLKSVKGFVNKFLNDFNRLDGLVNNAAVMNTSKNYTEDGFELQFGTNFLGHFLLTELLLPLLKKSKEARIIHTSSVFHEKGLINLDDLQL